MYKYNDYVLNEAKTNELTIGAYVLFVTNFKNYSCLGNVGIIESTEGTGEKTRYNIKLQERPLEGYGDPKTHWKAMDTKTWKWVDTINISKSQIRKSLVISKEIFDLWKRNNLISIECSPIFDRVLFESGFEIKMKYSDISYIDIGANENEITFLPVAKIKSDVTGRWNVRPYELKTRQSMRVSKLLKKMNPSLTTAQLEDEVNKYRAAYKIIMEGAADRVRVVTGEDIRYWYLGTRYADRNIAKGTLNSSCMRHNGSQKRFNIYCENPDKCALIIYVNKNEELLARALIWKLDNGEVYMDRIYYVNAEDALPLKKYAIDHGMKLYSENYHTANALEITLKKNFGEPYKNPYMDTFRYFLYKDKKLINDVMAKKLANEGTFRDYYTYSSHD